MAIGRQQCKAIGMHYLRVVLMLVAMVSTACSSDDPVNYQRSCPAGDGSQPCGVFDLVNQERADAGLGPYEWDPALAHAAQAHCDDMLSAGYFDHRGADGSSFSERTKRAGYEGSPVGENIARGSSTPEQVMARWMSSDGHRANILSKRANEIGVGFCGGGMWVQVFGKE